MKLYEHIAQDICTFKHIEEKGEDETEEYVRTKVHDIFKIPGEDYPIFKKETAELAKI